MKARKTALLGILCAQAIALSFLENLIPSLPFLPPGAKPGFSNIVTMFTVLTLGLPQAMCITVFKALFALMTRGATAFFMSLAGGVLSTLAMWAATKIKSDPFGLLGASIIANEKLVSQAEMERFADAILKADRIFVAGAGRSGFVARAFANRLMHMGLTVYFVGEPTTPAIK